MASPNPQARLNHPYFLINTIYNLVAFSLRIFGHPLDAQQSGGNPSESSTSSSTIRESDEHETMAEAMRSEQGNLNAEKLTVSPIVVYFSAIFFRILGFVFYRIVRKLVCVLTL